MKQQCSKCPNVYDIDINTLSPEGIDAAYTCPACGNKMYDVKKADRVVNFFTKHLHHTKGRQFNNKKFQFIPWEEKLIRVMFGVVRPDGTRQYRKVFVFIAKKNGKSELASGVALYTLFADGEPGAQVYSSAGDREQASIVFNTAIEMIQMDKKLESISKIRESIKKIIYPKTHSTYKVLSSEVKTKEGFNPYCSVIDELHVIPREQYDVLTSGVGAARLQPLIFMITTAGNDHTSICYEEYDYAKKVNAGIIQDNTYLAIIFEMDEKDDWHDEKNWYKANPSFGYTISIDEMRQEYKTALERPSQIPSFRQRRLNQWVSSHSKWINVERWDECRADYILEDFKGELCFAGLDLSSTLDITAFKVIFRRIIDEKEHYYQFQKFWCPKENIILRSRRDKVPYILWAQQGFLTPTEGNSVDQDFIKADIFKFAKFCNLQQINFDRWGMEKLKDEFSAEGLTLAAFGQGWRSMSMPSKEFEVLVLQKRFHHDGNPIDRWMIDNVIIRTDPAGNIKPDKAKSIEKIDGVVADIMGLDGWLRQPVSTYERSGVKIVGSEKPFILKFKSE